MGLIFLRHAFSRFLRVKDEIEAMLPTRGGKKREILKANFSQKGAIFLRQKGLKSTGLSKKLMSSCVICGRKIGKMSASERRSILHLTLEREWFDEIARGVKDEEYRDLKDYWKTRLEGRTYDIVRFRNGYATDAPEMDVEFLGVDKRSDCYVIRLGKVLRVKRWLA